MGSGFLWLQLQPVVSCFFFFMDTEDVLFLLSLQMPVIYLRTFSDSNPNLLEVMGLRPLILRNLCKQPTLFLLGNTQS